jgi:hypothetical protein
MRSVLIGLVNASISEGKERRHFRSEQLDRLNAVWYCIPAYSRSKKTATTGIQLLLR